MSKDDDKPEKLLAPVPAARPRRPELVMANPKGSPRPPMPDPLPTPYIGSPANPKGNPMGRFPPDGLPEARVRDPAHERRRLVVVLVAVLALAIIGAIVWFVQR